MSIHNDFIDFILHIKKRPGMYVTSINYDTIVSFIRGYNFNRDNNSERESSNFYGFEEYLQVKLGYQTSLVWEAIVLKLFCNDNKEKALTMFFELYEDFYFNVVKKEKVKQIIEERSNLKDDYISFVSNK